MQFRELRFAAGKADAKTRSVPVTVSSEQPVDRGAYVEVLDHAPGAVDLSRAPLPLIESHNDQQLNIGVVEQLQVVRGRLVGMARFGTSRRAEEVFRDVLDKVVQGVSIGYELVDQGVPVAHPSGRARKFKFRPLEVSAVAVPADSTVGFFRSHSPRNPSMTSHLNDAPDAPVPTRSQRRAAAHAAGDADLHEQDRVRGIMALATSHGLRELGERAIASGMNLETFRGQALDVLHLRGSDKPLYQPASQIGLSERETRDFSVARLFRSLIDQRPDLAPFERECVNTVQGQMQRAGMASARGGLHLPYELMRAPIPGAYMRDGHVMVGDRVLLQRDLATSSVGAGAAMVAVDHLAGSFIEFLRARTLVFQMGALRLSGLVGNVSIPRQTGSTSPGWVAQSGAASESDATFAVVTLTPKTAHGIQDVTRDLLIQGSPAVEGLVRADLLATMATTIDYAAINGSGSSNQPTGLSNVVGIGAVVGGTNGAAPTWDHMVEFEEVVATANADRGLLGYLTNPAVRAKLKRTQKFASTNGQEIYGPPMNGDEAGTFGAVNGYRCGITTHVRSDLTKGSSSGVCSAIFFGAWNDLMIGEWATAEILPDQVTQAANRIVRMHVWQTVDIAVRRPQSFAAMADALTS